MILSRFALSSFLILGALAMGCSRQKEGERCSLLNGETGDCEPGLICTDSSLLRNDEPPVSRCCPENGDSSDSRCDIKTGGNAAAGGGGAGGAGSSEGGPEDVSGTGDPCETQNDCEGSLICVSPGRCEDRGFGDACLYHSDCQEPLRCGPGGTCQHECNEDRDCGDGGTCDALKSCAAE